MEMQKLKKEFDILLAQKKGSAAVSTATHGVVNTLVGVILVGVLGGTIFSYLGNTTTGLGNSTLNPSVPTWLPTVLQVIVAVGMLYLILKITGVAK